MFEFFKIGSCALLFLSKVDLLVFDPLCLALTCVLTFLVKKRNILIESRWACSFIGVKSCFDCCFGGSRRDSLCFCRFHCTSGVLTSCAVFASFSCYS